MEPKRWVNEHESPEVRLALRAGIAMLPPPDAERACWAALGAALASGGAVALSAGAAGALGSVPASTAPSALGLGAVTKLLAIGASVGVLVSGGAAVVSHLSRDAAAPHGAVAPAPGGTSTPSTVRAVPAGDAPRKPDGTDALELRAVERESTPSVAAAPAEKSVDRSAPPPAPANGGEPARASRSNEESALVLSAREALRAGDPGEALRMLERARQAFGAGSLGEERLALEIDASLAAGKTAQAKRAARTFLSLYPQSPHAARFRALQ